MRYINLGILEFDHQAEMMETHDPATKRARAVVTGLALKRLLLLFSIGMTVTSSMPNLAGNTAAAQSHDDPRVTRVLEILRNNTAATTDEQIRITEIPAPPFHEDIRAAYMKKQFSAAGLRVESDAIGNVIGEWAGSSPDIVMLTAHLDTVFPAGTDVRVRREGTRLLAPGISDNGTGLVALLALANAFHEARVKTKMTILFVADVGEEGEGNLRGMRMLAETYKKRLKYVIAL